jgi:hypothetical protein
VLPPGLGAIADSMGNSNCRVAPVPALAVISTSSGREKAPVEGARLARPLASVIAVFWEKPSKTFKACCELPSSPEVSTDASASGRKIML